MTNAGEIARLLEELRAFVRERDWEQYHDVKNLAMMLASEAGELLAELRWVSSDRADEWAKQSENAERIRLELADITIALLLCYDRLGLDPSAAVRDKIAINRANYPVALARGLAERPKRSQSEGEGVEGLYMMAAGSSSQNRRKTLDRSWRLDDLMALIPSGKRGDLRRHFSEVDPVYLWGANHGSLEDLRQVPEGGYVVDVKNREVPHVFRFCFFCDAQDHRIQERVEWDAEKPPEERRPYRYVYFLKKPIRPRNLRKAHLQRAFGAEDQKWWLRGQRWFPPSEVRAALARAGVKTVEQLLKIDEP